MFVGDLLDCRGPLFYYFKFYFLEFLTEGVCWGSFGLWYINFFFMKTKPVVE